MNDLETKLRKEFDETARSVPESDEPWRALQRRLARRRAVLVGAAAAAVLVAVAIVVPLTRHQAPVTPATAAPTKPTLSTAPSAERPVLLLAETGGYQAWVYESGSRKLCVGTTADGAVVDPAKGVCEPDVTDDVSGHSPVRTRVIGPDGGPFDHFLLFVVDKDVRDFAVQRADGSPAKIRLAGTTAKRQFWVADFEGSSQGFGYSGIDAQGNHFSAIT